MSHKMCILSKNIDKNESKIMTYIRLFPYNMFREIEKNEIFTDDVKIE